MSVSKSGEFKAREGDPFKFFHYSTLTEAEGISRDIGFPPFCCAWAPDGTILVGGGGGTKGTGVRSAMIACRLVDGEAAERGSMCEALVDPIELAHSKCRLPIRPQLQAVGEVSTDDEIVFSIDQRVMGDDTLLAASVGPYTCLFEMTGFGSLSSSPLPPCLPHGVLDLLAAEQAVHQQQQPIIPGTPFKSPLLSRLKIPGASLSSLLSQLTEQGPRKLTLKYKFRTDFSLATRSSDYGYQIACVLSPDASVLVTGGSDGLVRAFLLEDNELPLTAVTAGKKYPQTPGKGVVPAGVHVSPLSMCLGRVEGEVQSLTLSSDGTLAAVCAAGEGIAPLILSVPSPSVLRARGTRIPVDYLDEQGDIIGYTKDNLSTTFADPASSYSLLTSQQAALPSPLSTLNLFEPQLEVVKLLFYSPPSVGKWQGPSPPADAFARLDAANKQCLIPDNNHLLLAVVNVPRTGPSTLCKVLVAADGTHSRLSVAVPISPKHTVTQMGLSPNGHYLAIATNADLHIFTGPCPAEARKVHLRALGQPVTSDAPPLSRVSLRERCFEMPCTGIAFDPSSRIAVGVCATRAVVFLPVSGMSKAPKNQVRDEKRGCCNVFWSVLAHVLMVILVGILVAKYNDFTSNMKHDQFS